MRIDYRVDAGAILMGVAFAIMWSSAFTSARIIVQTIDPLSALAIRFALSGVIAIGIALFLGQSMHLSRKQWLAVVVFGFCQNAIYLGANFIAMQWIEASLAAIIASTMPLQVALISRLFMQERINWLGILGLILGFSGVMVIMSFRFSGGMDVIAIILCVIASLALCIATLTVRNASSGGNLLMIVGLQMFVGCGIVLGPALLFESMKVNQWSWEFVAAFAYQTIVPGIIATWIWFTLVNRIGPTKASSFHFLNPFLGVAVAAIVLNENIGIYDVLGVAIITLGIMAVQAARVQQTP